MSPSNIRLPLLVAALVCAALALAPTASASSCANTSLKPGGGANKAMIRSTLCLLNAERARRGMPKLRLNKKLSKAAKRHSKDMAVRNYFSHTSLSGTSFIDRIKRTGFLRGAHSWMVGENLAWGSGRLSSPGSTVNGWMHSSGHRANILTRRFRSVGIGIVFDAPMNVHGLTAATYTTDFGQRH